MASSDEYITPKKYIIAACKLMGGPIDLDPATTKKANNEVVGAGRFWTKDDDCLSKGIWSAERVWMNPPYSRAAGTAGPYVHRLIRSWREGQVEQAVILLNCVPGNNWFQPLWEFPMCFKSSRIKFLQEQENGSLEPQKNPRYDNVFIYLPKFHKKHSKSGKDVLKFQEIFSDFGYVTNMFQWLRNMNDVIDSHGYFNEWLDKNEELLELNDSR